MVEVRTSPQLTDGSALYMFFRKLADITTIYKGISYAGAPHTHMAILEHRNFAENSIQVLPKNSHTAFVDPTNSYEPLFTFCFYPYHGIFVRSDINSLQLHFALSNERFKVRDRKKWEIALYETETWYIHFAFIINVFGAELSYDTNETFICVLK